MSSPSSSRALAFAALTAAGCLWGTGFIFGKLAFAELGVGHMLLYRFLFAAAGFVIVLVRNPVRIARRDWGTLLAAAVLGVPVQFLVQFEGLARTTASHASLMIGAAPVFLAVGGYFVFRERLGWMGWLALVLSTLGVALIAMSSSSEPASASTAPPPSVFGDILVLLSLIAGIAWILISKRLMEQYAAAETGALIVVVGSVILAAWVLVVDGPPPTTLRPATWLSLAALGVIATTCTTLLWNWGLTRIPAGQAGVFLNFEPIVGAILGVFLLHEVLGVVALAGGVLIVGAAIVVSLQPSH